jgi:hypothetical protein
LGFALVDIDASLAGALVTRLANASLRRADDVVAYRVLVTASIAVLALIDVTADQSIAGKELLACTDRRLTGNLAALGVIIAATVIVAARPPDRADGATVGNSRTRVCPK